MILSEWIEKYCEDNGIELPSDIPDEKTALQFLSVNGSGGGGYDYRIDVTISGSTVTADYNGATLTEIATAYADDASTAILAIIHSTAEYETRQALILHASYNTSWGDIASKIVLMSFTYDDGDNKYFVRRTVLAGSGNSTSTKAM